MLMYYDDESTKYIRSMVQRHEIVMIVGTNCLTAVHILRTESRHRQPFDRVALEMAPFAR